MVPRVEDEGAPAQLQIGGVNENDAADESAGEVVPRAEDEGTPARGKKDTAKTVADLKQEIEMVLAISICYGIKLYPPLWLLVRSH